MRYPPSPERVIMQLSCFPKSIKGHNSSNGDALRKEVPFQVVPTTSFLNFLEKQVIHLGKRNVVAERMNGLLPFSGHADWGRDMIDQIDISDL